jgi:hypothetical protein
MAATKEAVQPTQERDAGAVSHEEEQWHGTDWYQAHRNVRRLQIRIVKATRIPTSPAQACVHTQEKREDETIGYSRYEVQSDAGSLLAGT